jgi:hypothetical protein
MERCIDTVRKVKKLKYVTYKYDSAFICSQKKVNCGKNTSPLSEDVQRAVSFTATEMLLSPNPASNRLNIAVTTGRAGTYNAEVIDVNGRIILSHVVQLRAENSSVNIDVAVLKRGYYMLKLSGNGKTLTKQFMKE